MISRALLKSRHARRSYHLIQNIDNKTRCCLCSFIHQSYSSSTATTTTTAPNNNNNSQSSSSSTTTTDSNNNNYSHDNKKINNHHKIVVPSSSPSSLHPYKQQWKQIDRVLIEPMIQQQEQKMKMHQQSSSSSSSSSNDTNNNHDQVIVLRNTIHKLFYNLKQFYQLIESVNTYSEHQYKKLEMHTRSLMSLVHYKSSSMSISSSSSSTQQQQQQQHSNNNNSNNSYGTVSTIMYLIDVCDALNLVNIAQELIQFTHSTYHLPLDYKSYQVMISLFIRVNRYHDAYQFLQTIEQQQGYLTNSKHLKHFNYCRVYLPLYMSLSDKVNQYKHFIRQHHHQHHQHHHSTTTNTNTTSTAPPTLKKRKRSIHQIMNNNNNNNNSSNSDHLDHENNDQNKLSNHRINGPSNENPDGETIVSTTTATPKSHHEHHNTTNNNNNSNHSSSSSSISNDDDHEYVPFGEYQYNKNESLATTVLDKTSGDVSNPPAEATAEDKATEQRHLLQTQQKYELLLKHGPQYDTLLSQLKQHMTAQGIMKTITTLDIEERFRSDYEKAQYSSTGEFNAMEQLYRASQALFSEKEIQAMSEELFPSLNGSPSSSDLKWYGKGHGGNDYGIEWEDDDYPFALRLPNEYEEPDYLIPYKQKKTTETTTEPIDK